MLRRPDGSGGGTPVDPRVLQDRPHVFLNVPWRVFSSVGLATQEGRISYDPRYKMEDLYNPGLQGQFSVKFIF